jgi:hypothetical protein
MLSKAHLVPECAVQTDAPFLPSITFMPAYVIAAQRFTRYSQTLLPNRRCFVIRQVVSSSPHLFDWIGGVLVAGDCNAPNALPVPFRIQLRRAA